MATWTPSPENIANANTEIEALRLSAEALDVSAKDLCPHSPDETIERLNRIDDYLSYLRRETRAVRRRMRHFQKCKEDAFNGKVHQ